MSDDKKFVTHPFGGGVGVVVGAAPGEADEIQRKINARGAFVVKYAREQGWIGPDEEIDVKKLSIEQILEIRDQDGWKNA